MKTYNFNKRVQFFLHSFDDYAMLTSENHKRIPARSVEHGDKRTNRAVCLLCSFLHLTESQNLERGGIEFGTTTL